MMSGRAAKNPQLIACAITPPKQLPLTTTSSP
jgi:hypothetical protein